MSLQPMDVFDTRYFRINKLMLSFVGLWPMQSNKTILYYCVILGTWIIILPQIEKFRMIVQHVRHDWCLLEKSDDIWILMEYAERSRMFTLSYLSFLFISTVSFMTAPLTMPLLDSILASNVTRPKQMPHPSEFLVDIEKYYYILLAITFVGYIACWSIVAATDTIYVALLQHICAILIILGCRLKKLAAHDKSNCTDRNYVSRRDRDVEHLIKCIQLQVRIERLIHLIETSFAVCLFTDIGLGILLQCCACVMIVTQTELLRNAPLVSIQVVRFFFWSWLGQKIVDYSSQISVAAYNRPWYLTSLEAEKILLFLLMKSQKPNRITMVKLYVICLESYSSIMRASVSYVMLMISLNSNDT
ncbi:PREDICTED: odorant receptor 67c-like isoform X2 [Wasmannia auropunctata]|uniref:odorant receptor 67c-like isoform X2 n=1 Tax=Wasmannia auropunctata TaxID=64793 RepID=UPI0005EF75A4|nr:PREDICTED: odorant receptor 67c-like isoform X2 [Wasmannia auropunctata]